MDKDQLEEVEKLYKKFENDALDKIKADKENFRIVESGQPRNFLRNLVSGLVKFADKRLEAEYQVKLCMMLASDFYEFGEYRLALENFEAVLARCDSIPNELAATKHRVESMQKIVMSNYAELMQLKNPHIAPMVVSKLLLCLQQLRYSLENIFELPSRQQEGLAWLVLNSCKLILEIGQPLIWQSCGKYVTETLLFAATAMEAVINLCTVRHMKFRMKLYSSVFYSALAHSATDEAAGLLEHTRKQVSELKEREELDPPVPAASTACLQRCQLDLAVMQFALDFWRDPDSLALSETHLTKYYKAPSADIAVIPLQSFADLCISECIRVHLLTSGNANEPFRKRSSCILKGVAAALHSYGPTAVTAPSSEEKQSEGSAPDAGTVALMGQFTMRSLLEIAMLAMFCSADGVDSAELLAKLCHLGQEKSQLQEQGQQDASSPPVSMASGGKQNASAEQVDRESLEHLQLLSKLHSLVHTDSEAAAGVGRGQQVLELVQRLDTLTYSEHAYRSKAFMRKISLELWRAYLYPAVQEVLSDLRSRTDSISSALIAEMAPALLTAVKVLDITGLEDPILLGSMALVSAQLQWELGDQRGSIALAQQAIYTIEEHRMCRVDALQHIPEDVRDILALQRGSFTTRSDSQDWFHSVKRLGAHAFAGYGIFGLSSSADRGDQAMAEVQADLLAYYFRAELAYCVAQLAEKHRIRSIIQREEKQRTAAAEALLQGIKLKPSAGKTATATRGSTMRASATNGVGAVSLDLSATLAASAYFGGVLNATTLPVYHTLRAFCAKNGYYKCILFLELARIDTDDGRKSDYLHDALDAIEECEGREQLLKENFAELLIMTETQRRCPLIVARSHRYVYIAPAGCRRLRKAEYYRIFAKEKGSGTDVSIHNDDIAGCEQRVYLKDLHNLRNSVVRIGPLRAGEQYVFGCAGFTAEDKVTGGLSPTSVVVDAVNPLPTILLWSWLTQSAQESDFAVLSKEVSARVVNRYFLPTPAPTSRTVGKGINLFLFCEPALCMLALQQSSPLLLQCFVDSCLSYEKIFQSSHIEAHSAVNWTRDCPTQLAALTSLHRTALVCTVACGIQNYELTLHSVKLGYDVALELLRFEAVHLAGYMQAPLLVLVMAMQTTPKRHWSVLEHKLYTKLLAHTVKAGALSRNITPVIAVLNSFYPEVLESSLEEAAAARPAEVVLSDYSALLGTVQQCVASTHIAQFMDMMRKLAAASVSAEEHALKEADASTATGVGYIWSLSAVSRRLMITPGTAVDLLKTPDEKASAECVLLEKALTADKPAKMSDYLELLVLIAQDVAGTPQAAELHRLIQRFPICQDYLALRLVDISGQWGATGLQTLDAILAAAAQVPQVSPRTAAAAQKKPPAKGAAPEPSEEELQAAREAARTIPERFLGISDEEQSLQCRYLGQLLHILAVQGFPGAGKAINHFPQSTSGPKLRIDPSTFTVDRTLFQSASAAVPSAAEQEEAAPLPEAEGVSVSPREPTAGVEGTDLPVSPRPSSLLPAVLSPSDHLRLLGASIDLLRESGANSAATQVACTLWRFIVGEWKDPAQFAAEFFEMHEYMMKIFRSVTVLLEQLSFVTVPEVLEEDEQSQESSERSPVRNLESSGIFATDLPLSSQREAKENLLILRDLVSFLIKVEWILSPASWELVQLGSRAFKVILLNSPEYLKEFGDHCLPLIMNAQEVWIEKAEKFKARRQKELDTFVFNYEEAQRKKRKKKLRVARLEKDEEELLFEAERDVYQQRVDAAQQALEVTLEEMKQVKLQQARFHRLHSHGAQMLDRVKAHVRAFMEDVTTTAQSHPSGAIADAALLLHLYPDLDEKLHQLQQQFRPVFSILREKKEKVLLVEALKLLGDVLLYFRRMAEAKSVWNDAIDGLFNVMDACIEWKAVCADAVASLEPQLIPGVLPAVVVLSKLSRYCASQDWDSKAGYARMAAELCRIPFQGSLGHPLSVAGFAAYECLEVGGVLSLGLRDEALSAADLTTGLHEILHVLVAEKQFIAALPVVVLLEHFCSAYLNSPSQWLSARLVRIRLLISGHLFAEAAAMFASLKFSIQEIHAQSAADGLRSRFCQQTGELKSFETSKNALNFHGFAPYFNNLPPDEETHNMAALQWIADFPSEFEVFAKGFKIALPAPVLTPEELAAEEERKARAAEEAAAAAAAAKKGKSGKGKEAEAPVLEEEEDKTSAPMFTAFQIAELHISCAHFLLEISMLEERSTLPHAMKLKQWSARGMEILTTAAAQLFSLLPSETLVAADGAGGEGSAAAAPESSSVAVDLLCPENIRHVRNKDWLRLYGRVFALRCTARIHARSYKEARAASESILTLLRSSALAQGLSGDVRGVLTQIWFSAKDFLITISDRQARFKDVLKLANESAREASMQLAGHWLRSYLLHRAQSHFKLGHLKEALQDCSTCAAQYASNYLEDLGLVRVLCLKATIEREQSLYAEKGQCIRAYLDCLELVRRAGKIAKNLAEYAGAFPADSNVTYGRGDTAVKQHHMIAPVLQSLTELHGNEPNLSLTAQFDKKKLHQRMGIMIPSLQQQNASAAVTVPNSTAVAGNGISTTAVLSGGTQEVNNSDSSQPNSLNFQLSSLRLAPVDRKEGVYCESEFANIYLQENQALLACQALLCQVIDDACNSGLLGNSAFLEVYEPNALVNEQLAMGESALKLSRHCLYLPTPLRITTLVYVSKARIAKKSKFEGNAEEFLFTLISPLIAALDVAVQSHSSQLWALLRKVCIELVEVYGDHDLDLGEEIGPQRLKIAVIYLLAAIKLSNQKATLMQSSIGLSADASFDAPLPEELKHLVTNLSSSSATPDPEEAQRLAVAEAEAAAQAAKAPPAKGKGKAPPAGAVPTTGAALVPSGRDALYLLCALLRERDPLWVDSPEQQLCADLHSLLRSSFPLYSSKCCLTECPDPNDTVDVACSTVSTLWIPTKAPEAFAAVLERPPNQLDYSSAGVYSHVSVFFLFGDATLPGTASTAAGETSNSKEPILTKLVLPRTDVAHLEQTFRDIRDKLLDAESKVYRAAARSCQDSFGEALVLLLGLLKNGIITQEQGNETSQPAQFHVTESKAAGADTVATYDLTVVIKGERSSTSILLKVTSELLLHFAEVLCVERDAELVKDNFVCAFLRTALGYKVSAAAK